jgi:DNA-binding NtrC family response regulator
METEPHKILVIDDQIGQSKDERADFLEAIGYYLNAGTKKKPNGYPYEFEFHTGQTESGSNSVEAVKAAVLHRWPAADGKRWALVLLDVRFDEKSGRTDENFGFTLLRALREDSRFGKDLPIVMLTSEGKGKKLAAGKLNADDFFPKSDESEKPLWSEAGLRKMVIQNGLIPDDRDESSFATTNSARLLGRSLAFLKVLRDARRYALNPRAKRILYGESGSGKTWLAAYIHCYSLRSGPFIHWTADPASKDTLKDELFGHWKGAFTGADYHQAGKIEHAHLGTFFLDEVANLPIEVQKALLKILRDPDENGARLLTRLGNFPSDDRQRKAAMSSIVNGVQLLHGDNLQVNVLLFPGTNRNLEDPTEREKDMFQADLLWGLGTPLRFPNLNERREEILFLFQAFAKRVAVHQSVDVETDLPIEDSVIDLLRNRDWSHKGNVRDLKRIAEFAASRFGAFGQIRFSDLPPDVLEDAKTQSTNSFPATTAVRADREQESALAVDDGNQKPGALAKAELAHLRQKAELLEEAAEATRKVDSATGMKGEFRPTAAVERLMGNKLPKKGATTSAVRIIKDILGTILNTPEYLEHAYGKQNLEALRAWVKTRPVLMSLFRYSTKEISADKIHEHL